METHSEKQTVSGGTSSLQPIVFTVQTNAQEEPKGFLGRLLGRKKVETSRTFTIKPPKMGKLQILSRYLLQLDLNDKALEEDPINEAARVCTEKPDIACELMAAAVCNRQEELENEDYRKELTEFFRWNADAKDFGALILAIIKQNDYPGFIASLRLLKAFRMNEPRKDTEASVKNSNPIEQEEDK